MVLLCDYRESKVISQLQSRKKVVLDVQNLPTGDFVANNIVIERKTLDDLSSSIIDGRYAEQKRRLIQCVQNGHNVVLLVEGGSKSSKGVPYYTTLSSMASCVCQGISVLRSQNLDETCILLEKLEEKSAHSQTKTEPPTLRKDTGCSTYNAMLQCVPGISGTLACRIELAFPTFSTFLHTLHNDNQQLLTIERLGPKVLDALKQVFIDE